MTRLLVLNLGWRCVYFVARIRRGNTISFLVLFNWVYTDVHQLKKLLFNVWLVWKSNNSIEIQVEVSNSPSTCLFSNLYINIWVIIGFWRVFTNGPGDLGSIPGRVIPKTLKMVLDTSFLNTQHYKIRIKGKVEQSRERSSALLYTSV